MLSLRRRDSGSSCIETGSWARRMGGWADESKLAMENESELNIRLMDASAHLSAMALADATLPKQQLQQQQQPKMFFRNLQAAPADVKETSGGRKWPQGSWLELRRLEIPDEDCTEWPVRRTVSLTPPESFRRRWEGWEGREDWGEGGWGGW